MKGTANRLLPANLHALFGTCSPCRTSQHMRLLLRVDISLAVVVLLLLSPPSSPSSFLGHQGYSYIAGRVQSPTGP
uniref:Uncharacterized protein n=1 Tax=Leishmania guyanensis TaxID=5670 RepID=A0A1E1J202_LEIGU|nr:Hypothetical protein BN36_3051090 [Leishmania guyanensis]